jgi:ATP-binding cassette, subfamily C, bacterial CydC
LRAFGRLLGFLRPHAPRVGLAVLLGVATVASNVGLLAVAAYVISAAAIVPLFGYLVLPSYFVRLFGLSRAGARYAERMVSHDLTFRLLANKRTWFYRRLEPLAPARLLGHRSGDLLSRVVRDVEELENLYLRISSPIAVAAIVTLLTTLVFYAFDPTLALVALAFLTATGVGVPLLVARLARGLGRQQLELRAALNARIVDDVQGIQDLLAFGREEDERRGIAELDGRLGRVQNRMAFITGLQDSLSDLMTNLAVVAILVLAIPPVAAGEIRGVHLAFLALVMLGSFEAVQPLGRAFQFLGRSVGAGERLFEVADAQPEVADPERPLPVPTNHTVRFEDVTFRYDPDSPPVLRNVFLALEPGRRVAIVGPSGAGKSTLVDLVLRFRDPSAGRVTLGGRDLRDLAQEDLRAHVSVVSQDTHVFTDTLRGNLLLAKAEATDDELKAVLDRARLLDLAGRLPEGLDTYLGEQGSRLSGGERQRLSIARALLKDAPILVLDEPTANLDPGTEGEVLDAAYELVENRATLVITHRLVRMEEMDEILVLDRGGIVGRGTHEELANARGLYRDLYEAQRGVLVGT